MKIFSKTALLFFGVYLGSMILGSLIFVLIFSQLVPQGVTQNLFGDQVVSILFIFFFYIVFPSLVAYQVTLSKKTAPEFPNESAKIRFAAVSIVAISLLLVGLVTWISNDFDPLEDKLYNYTVVTEKDLLPKDKYSPDKNKELLTAKQIDGESYQLYKDIEGSEIVLYKNNEGPIESSLPIVPPVRDFWYRNPYIFIIQGSGTIGQYEEISKLTLSREKNLKKEIWSFGKPGVYSATTIVNYYHDGDQLLLLTRGGDGCGGWGKVWLLTSNLSTSLQEFGLGCGVSDNKPEYIGYNYNSEEFYFAVRDTSDKAVDFQNWSIKSYFSLNPRTGEKKTISKPDNNTYISL